MERELTLGETARFTMVNGSKDRKQGTESGKGSMVIATLASGSTVRPKDLVFILGSMVTDTKENGKPA